MDFAEMLSVLGAEMRLDLHASSKSGICVVRFDDRLDVIIAIEPTLQSSVSWVKLRVEIGTIAAADEERILPMLLQIHLLGLATDDAYFTYAESRRAVALIKTLSLTSLDPESVVHRVESFVNQAMRWEKALPTLGESVPQIADVPAHFLTV